MPNGKKCFHIGNEYIAHLETTGAPVHLVYMGDGRFDCIQPRRPDHYKCDIRKVSGGFECAICNDLQALFSIHQASYVGHLDKAPYM